MFAVCLFMLCIWKKLAYLNLIVDDVVVQQRCVIKSDNEIAMALAFEEEERVDYVLIEFAVFLKYKWLEKYFEKSLEHFNFMCCILHLLSHSMGEGASHLGQVPVL